MFNKIKRPGMGRLHGNHKLYWEYQVRVTNEKLIPILREWNFDPQGKRILEIGSGDGGIIHTFAEMGATCTGLDLNEKRAEIGTQFATIEIPTIIGDFCTPEILAKLDGNYDLILVRDVLEHLLDKETALTNINKLLAKDGHVFFDFPSWYMAFAGHQQAMNSFLRYIPFIHYLPRSFYARLVYWSEKERPQIFSDLMDTYDARITFNKFEKLVDDHGLLIEKSRMYLVNPSYEIKFGWPEIRLKGLEKLPFIREVLASNIYAWVGKV